MTRIIVLTQKDTGNLAHLPRTYSVGIEPVTLAQTPNMVASMLTTDPHLKVQN